MTQSVPQDLLPPLPVSAADLLAYLKTIGVTVSLHEHEPVFTVAQSSKIDKKIDGVPCRNLFLRDKKKRNYLVVAANETEIDLKKLQDLLRSNRLSFGSAERLWQYLGVRPGSVCPFSIINDKENDVEIYLDYSMMQAETACYHPMENHLTVGIAPDDLIKFIESCGHTPHIIDLSHAAPNKDE